MANKILLVISGASGAIYPKLLIDRLNTIRDQWEELSIVMSNNARQIWKAELGHEDYNQVEAKFYEKHDFGAPFASGSAKYNIMIVCPCSMGTLARIATGISNDLVTRAADVILKERRRLILMLRETPYNLLHIKNMETITLTGGIICPATPLFYSNPTTVEEVAMTVVDRLIDLAGLDISTYRWGNHPKDNSQAALKQSE